MGFDAQRPHAVDASRVPWTFRHVEARADKVRPAEADWRINRNSTSSTISRWRWTTRRAARGATFAVKKHADYLAAKSGEIASARRVANLKGFIEARGGTAIGCTTLTGKPWSAKLTPSADTLRKLREKRGGELESWWEDTFGYRFDFLTESEARYLARADSVELIRNRILAARQAHDD